MRAQTGKFRTKYEARARVAKALAHPSRLVILDLLAEGERCVCELTAALELDQSTVSKHLAILNQAGIIEARREGARTFYRLRLECLKGLWDCIDAVLRENLRTQQAALGAES